MGHDIAHNKRTCAECPWRKDVPVGRFSADRYRALASTAYDMAWPVFTCHKTVEGRDQVCAGAILRTDHSLRLRMAGIDRDTITADGPLYENFREMAIANGVDPDDEALDGCR